MAVIIGHASIDERGKANSGQAGDQTGREVCTRNWYNRGWTETDDVEEGSEGNEYA